MSAAVKTHLFLLPTRYQAREDALKPYTNREDELTKPYASVPLEWIGEDEVTVRWETVQHEPSSPSVSAPASTLVSASASAPVEPSHADEFDEPAPAWRGIGPRGAGVALGVVLGIAISVGCFALLLGAEGMQATRTANAALLPERATEPPRVAALAVPQLSAFDTASVSASATARSIPPAPTPSGNAPTVVPIGQARPAVTVPPRRERFRPQLNVDATERANVILDGQPIGKTPRRLPVTPGKHVVVFIHPTKGRRTLTVHVPNDRVAFATAKF